MVVAVFIAFFLMVEDGKLDNLVLIEDLSKICFGQLGFVSIRKQYILTVKLLDKFPSILENNFMIGVFKDRNGSWYRSDDASFRRRADP